MKQTLTTRSLSLPKSGLTTLNEEERSIEVTAATERPAEVMDWERWEVVREVLLMSGARFPEQIPLLDAHTRDSVENVLGSVRDLRVEDGKLVGRAIYSESAKANDAYTKLREGHLTDYSIGYLVNKSEWIDKGNTKEIQGRAFEGPLRVATEFTVRELSTVPIGADEHAKVRVFLKFQDKEVDMPEPKKEEENRNEPVVPSQPKVDVEAIRAQERAEERKRAVEIGAIGEKFSVQDLAREAINGETTIEEFRAMVLERMGAEMNQNSPSHRVDIVAEARDKFRAASTDALLTRAGFDLDKPSPGTDDLTGFSLVEVARACLRNAGERYSGVPREVVSRAFTHSTSDFPLLLANIANKSLMKGFEKAEETWRTWCDVGSVSDFKVNTQVRPGELGDLKEIRELESYQYGTRVEEQEQYRIFTFGEMFGMSRQTIINDDLNSLTKIPAEFGEAVSRKLADLAYDTLFANANMGDSVALFHGKHGNVLGPFAFNIKNLGAAVTAMRLQKDIGNKRRLNIRPKFLLAPVAMETALEQFFRSNLEGTQEKPNLVNPFAGSYLRRIYESRLDDQNEFEGKTHIYLAGPKGKTVTLFFLNGNQKPYLESKQGWHVDGIEWKVRIDAGAKAMSWRALSEIELTK